MSRRYAFLMLVAVCLTATMALADETSAQPEWWDSPTFEGKDPVNHDIPDWWVPFEPKVSQSSDEAPACYSCPDWWVPFTGK